MSKKNRTPARSSTAAAPVAGFGGFGAPAFGAAAFSSSASLLSYAAEPPDLSGIADPAAVVLFKNLSKKDETTKSRALEDLQRKLAAADDVEEAVITAWVRLYPRLSTDISRRVRQLAHVLQKVICQKSGKRIAKHMPKIVGSWLAGLYDNDRGVSRAAGDALHSIINSEEKMSSVWRVYQGAILEYCDNAICTETVSSLSDERSVSPDDAEAKYARVMATTLFVMARLIGNLPLEELNKYEEKHIKVLNTKELSDFAHHPDAFLRRAIYMLAQEVVQKNIAVAEQNIEKLSTMMIMKALSTSQVGSGMDFLEAMIVITEHMPQLWTNCKPSKKKTPASQLTKFLSAGSQLGPPEYWDRVSKLIAIVPAEVLPRDLEGCRNLTRAIRTSIHSGPEPRTHIVPAWKSYFNVIYRLLELDGLEADAERHVLFEDFKPVYLEYIDPVPEKREFDISPKSLGAVILGNVSKRAGELRPDVFEKLLQGPLKESIGTLTDILKNDVGAESSGSATYHTYEVIRNTVLVTIEMFRALDKDNLVYNILEASSAHHFLSCTHRVVETGGKATGSALYLEELLTKTGGQVLALEAIRVGAEEFFYHKLPDLIGSPATESLLVSFVALGVHIDNKDRFFEAWTKVVRTLLMSDLEKERKEACIAKLLRSVPRSLRKSLTAIPELDSYVVCKLRASLEGADEAGWEISKSAFHLTGTGISEDASTKMLVDMTGHLSLDDSDKALAVCKELGEVAHSDPAVVASFVSREEGKDLLSKLLILTDSPDDAICAAASKASNYISNGLSMDTGAGTVVQSMIDIIKKGVTDPGDESLSLDYLAARTQNLVMNEPTGVRARVAESLLFVADDWEVALKPFYKKAVDPSLAVTNPLGSCVFLLEKSVEGSSPSNGEDISRDDQGFSTALRMAIYCIKCLQLLTHFDVDPAIVLEVFTYCSNTIRACLVTYIGIVVELAKDNLNVTGTNDLWNEYSPEVEVEVVEFITIAQKWLSSKAVHGFMSSREEQNTYPLVSVVDFWLKESMGSTPSPRSFYAARALAGLMPSLVEYRQSFRDRAEEWAAAANIAQTDDTLACTAMLTAIHNGLAPTLKEKLRNQLIDAMLVLSPSKASTDGLGRLLPFNSTLPEADEGVLSLPQPRAMLLLKHLLGWFDENNVEVELCPAIIVEAARTFAGVVPVVKSMYGEHWEKLLVFVKNCWAKCIDLEEEHLPMVFTTMKLFQIIRSLKGENDDLDEAWATFERPLYDVLTSLLLASRRPDTHHQPRNICNTQIGRQFRNIDLRLVDNEPETFYPLMKTQSIPIQEAAFHILHRLIPPAQEQVSIDAALSKDSAAEIQLPPELLSLVMDVPSVPLAGLGDSMRLELRGHLLSWILVFDHFPTSSFKVKSAYVEALKEGGYLAPLLDFIFKVLFPHGQSFDASKTTIDSYTPGVAETPTQDLQWLLTHLYYLALRYTPSLVKTWWLECKNRATVQAVEAFTEKHMSPLLIAAELASVAEWAQTRDADGEEGMSVKVSRTAREVTASYPVDDQAMEVVVRMPGTFPLRHVEVEGLRRVGLDEKQFKKMQLASQAVVNFWSGSIIDALTVFRKNVSLHFQGISECAICYSILAITPDRSLPNKGCTTCKNKFHSTCLWKWFKTSNSSSCPLCRTSFSFYS